MGVSEDDTPGEAAVRKAIEAHGEDVAAALEHTEHVKALIDTIIVVMATADEDDIDYLTDSMASLIATGDALATQDTPALAEVVGENPTELANALETLVRLERNDTLDDLAALGETAAGIELDDASVRGLNRLLSAVGEAEQTAQPMGLFGAIRATRTRAVRGGLGYLVRLVGGLDPRGE